MPDCLSSVPVPSDRPYLANTLADLERLTEEHATELVVLDGIRFELGYRSTARAEHLYDRVERLLSGLLAIEDSQPSPATIAGESTSSSTPSIAEPVASATEPALIDTPKVTEVPSRDSQARRVRQSTDSV